MGLFAQIKARHEKRADAKPLVIKEEVNSSGRTYRFEDDLVQEKGLVPLLRLYDAHKVFFVVFDLHVEEGPLETFVSSLSDVALFPLRSLDDLPSFGWAFYLPIDSLNSLFGFFHDENASYSSFFVETPYVDWEEFKQEIANPESLPPVEPKPCLNLTVKGKKVVLEVDKDYPVFRKGEDIGLVLTGKEIV